MVRRDAGNHARAAPGDRRDVLRSLSMDVGIFEERKIDCHVHVLDPARFPYGANTHYAPAGQELGTPAQLDQLVDAYGVRHVLLVGPNSGYNFDNVCMLDTIARSQGRYKGVAVVRNDATFEELRKLRDAGVVGVAWNVTFFGVDYYDDAEPLLKKLEALDMFVDIGADPDQFVRLLPLLENSDVRQLVDHCGRPIIDAGLGEAGFRALLELGASKRAFVKLSGFSKFSHRPALAEDTWP